jgi:hypothetical protein
MTDEPVCGCFAEHWLQQFFCLRKPDCFWDGLIGIAR